MKTHLLFLKENHEIQWYCNELTSGTMKKIIEKYFKTLKYWDKQNQEVKNYLYVTWYVETYLEG